MRRFIPCPTLGYAGADLTSLMEAVERGETVMIARGGSFARYPGAIGFREEPFLSEDAETASALPPLHRDPVDRVLIGTATRAGLEVIARDAALRSYGVPTAW